MERTRASRLRPRRPWHRVSAALALAFQIATVCGTPVAHALSQGENPGAHVEAPGNKSCPAAHHDGACQICRVITAPATAAAVPRIPALEGAAQPRLLAVAVPTIPSSHSVLGPRSPPIA